ncbi:hypothetical protein WPS_00450 [Vulcanimicrobium alpinum]|uniref:Uncharacterized protein n=1 Tax=Vulcanimicrobium alpinum TaxID=3016050 RepID=A0AAN2C7Q7_UNVUL|nr:hypothetical protein WPS_00450 [Vulcanimicrobium alpinum]
MTITFASVICLSYCLPIWTSVEVGKASAGAGMLALTIASMSAMTAQRRKSIGASSKAAPVCAGDFTFDVRSPGLSTDSRRF